MLTIKYGLPEKQYDTREKVIGFHESLLERVRRLPGVRAAALRFHFLRQEAATKAITSLRFPGALPAISISSTTRATAPLIRSTSASCRSQLISGRVFYRSHERLTNDHYVIISKKFATQFFPGENAIGKRINVGWYGKLEDFEILGVVADTIYDVTQPVMATMYFPILSGSPAQTSASTIVVRTETNPLALSIPVQQQVASLDPAGASCLRHSHHGSDGRKEHSQSGLQCHSGPCLCSAVAPAGPASAFMEFSLIS